MKLENTYDMAQKNTAKVIEKSSRKIVWSSTGTRESVATGPPPTLAWSHQAAAAGSWPGWWGILENVRDWCFMSYGSTRLRGFLLVSVQRQHGAGASVQWAGDTLQIQEVSSRWWMAPSCHSLHHCTTSASPLTRLTFRPQPPAGGEVKLSQLQR